MRLSSTSTSCRFRPRSLDALNFLLADVRGALGPYLNVFLVWADGMMSARTDAVGGEEADVKAWSQPSTA